VGEGFDVTARFPTPIEAVREEVKDGDHVLGFGEVFIVLPKLKTFTNHLVLILLFVHK